MMLNCLVAICCGVPESVACAVKLDMPAVVGVPVIAPVAAFKVRPAGKVPTEIAHVTAGVPPLDCSVALYTELTAPVASELLVITSCWTMVRLSAFVTFCWGVPESAAWTVKLDVPAVVGVPEITPVLALRVSPAGSEPTETVQVIGDSLRDSKSATRGSIVPIV